MTADIDLGFGVLLTKQKLRLSRVKAPEIRGPQRSSGLKSRNALREKIDKKWVILESDGKSTLEMVLDLTGACLSCGAAPGTLDGIKADLEADSEVEKIRFSRKLLDTFDELGREFILAHGNVEFV